MKWATKNIQRVNFTIVKSKKRQKNASRRSWYFDKVELSKRRYTGPKIVSFGCIDFRNELLITLDCSVFMVSNTMIAPVSFVLTGNLICNFP